MAPRRRVCPKPLGQQISEGISNFTDSISQAWREAEQSNKEFWAQKAEEVASQSSPVVSSGDFAPETATDLPEEVEVPSFPPSSASVPKVQPGTPKPDQPPAFPRTTVQPSDPSPPQLPTTPKQRLDSLPQSKQDILSQSKPEPVQPSVSEFAAPKKVDIPVPDSAPGMTIFVSCHAFESPASHLQSAAYTS